MGEYSDGVLIALITAFVGPVVLILIKWARDKRKDQAVAEKDFQVAKTASNQGDASLVEVILQWAKDLREDIKELRSEVVQLNVMITALQSENRLLRHHNILLTAQVIRLGAVPQPMPDVEYPNPEDLLRDEPQT